MELLYIWIQDYKNIKQQGFNFSPQYRFDYKHESGELTVTENPNYIPDFFGKDSGISNVTAIIGKNGAGKSTLLEALQKPYLLETILVFGVHDEKCIISFEIEKEKSIDLEISKIDNQTQIPLYLESLYDTKKILSYSGIGEGSDTIQGIKGISYSPVFTGYYKEPSYYKENKESLIKGANPFNYAIDYQLSIKPLSQYKFEETQRQLFFINKFNDFKINRPFGIEMDILPHNEQFRGYDGINKDEANYELFQNIYNGDIIYCKNIVDLFVVETKWSYFFNISSLYFKDINFSKNDNIDIIWRNMINKKYDQKIVIPDKMDLSILYNIINIDFRKYISNFYNDNKKVNDRNFRIFREQDIPAVLFISIQNENDLFNMGKFIEFVDFFTFFEKEMIKYFHNSRDTLYFLRFNWNGLSSGELSHLNLFSSLNSISYGNLEYKDAKSNEIKDNDVILFLDEPDAYQHPDWVRKFIKRAIDYIPLIYGNHLESKNRKRNTQIIVTSHSPFLASDLPNENIIFLEKGAEGNCIVKDSLNDMKHTFGANIHTLLTDSFFMKDGLMGDFAKGKINEVIDDLISRDTVSEKRQKEIRNIINAVGDEIIKRKLMQMFQDKFNLDIDARISRLEQEIANLKQQKNNDTDTK